MLMYASEGGHEASVRALIEKGASVEAVDKVRLPTCASYSEYQRHNNMQYMYIYVYVYIYIHTHTHTHTHIHTYTYIHIYIYVCAYI